MANYTKVVKGKLTALKTSPDNVHTKAIAVNVTAQADYGINGGFFDRTTGAILNINVNDDLPVKGKPGEQNGGWFNAKYARGTLVFDKVMRFFDVAVISSAAEIEVVDRNAYWAIGGISMSLQDDAHWQAIATAQHMPDMTGITARNGVVWDKNLDLWLIVSTATTAADFRSQVRAMVPNVVDGIFRDGGGSVQMKALSTTIKGDGRAVRDMLALWEK